MAASQCAERVIKSYLVVQVIEVTVEDIVAVFVGVINFGNEVNVRILLLHLRNSPSPELYGYHLCHVTAEAVDFLGSPEQQNVQHLLPSVGYRVEVSPTSVHVIYAIVQLHGFIPVVYARPCIETVVAGCLGRIFHVWFRCVAVQVDFTLQLLSRDVIEIVLRAECHFLVVVLA